MNYFCPLLILATVNFPMGQQVVFLSCCVRANITAVCQFDSMKPLMNQKLSLDQETSGAMSAKM